MLRTTRQLQDTKADPQGRTRDGSGPFTDKTNPVRGLPMGNALAQANLGPLPSHGNYDQLPVLVLPSFSYGLLAREDVIFADTLNNNLTLTFDYGGEFVVSSNSDTLTNTNSLTFSYS